MRVISTDISGAGPGGVTAQPVGPEPQVETATPTAAWPTTPQYLGAYPPVAAPARPPFWRRPVGIVLISVAAVGFGMVLLFVVMVLFAFKSTTPLDRQVMAYDFAVEGDRPMIVEEGLSWDQSNGTLNLYPTNYEVQGLDFDLPGPSDAVKVEATLIEPAADEQVPMLWGIEAFNSETGIGVVLLCAPGGNMYVGDSRTGEPLPGAGVSDYPCEETMDMTLQVDGRLVLYGPDEESMSLYSGDVVYSDLDTASVVIYTQEPDQVLRVEKIAAYQR